MVIEESKMVINGWVNGSAVAANLLNYLYSENKTFNTLKNEFRLSKRWVLNGNLRRIIHCERLIGQI